MCLCTPERRTPLCPNCVLPKVKNIPPMPPVKTPPLCDLRAFYEATREHLDGYTFDKLVEKALQKKGV